MSAKNRLQVMQALLVQRGVRAVKFTLTPGATGLPLSTVQNGAADFIDAYLKGRTTVRTRIGDAPLVQ